MKATAWLAWMGVAAVVSAWSLLRPVYAPAPFGRWSGLALLAAGALLIFLSAACRRRFTLGLLLALAAVCLTAVADALLLQVETVLQREEPSFSVFAWLAARAAGAEAALRGADLLVRDPQGELRFAATWGVIAARPLLLLWTLGGLLLASSGGEGRWQGWLRLILLSLLFFGLRYAVLVLRYAATDDVLSVQAPPAIAMFWTPGSVLAAAAASCAATAAWDVAREWGPAPGLATCVRGGVLAAVGGLALGAAASWTDPGVPKQGRVLLDERLGRAWEPAGRLLDTERYGDFSAYSFSAMVEHLSHRFAVTVNGTEEYDADSLRDFDVLILKTPEEALGEEEVAAIHAWVADGGGLFLIGDHTDLLGMSTYLRPLASPYGIDFRFDSVAHVSTGGFNLWSAPWVPEHPVSDGLAPFECMTPCSLALRPGARPVLTLEQATSTEGDYAASSHFGGRAPRPAHAHGRLVLAAAAGGGKGRVMAFADSTVLSSFAYYTWSHADFVVRSVAWLNARASAGRFLSWAFLVLGVLAVGLSLSRPLGGAAWPAHALLLSLGIAAGAWGAGRLAAQGLAVPDPSPGSLRVGFVAEGGHAWLPAVLGTQPELPPHGNLMTFIQTPQRLGMETSVVPRDPTVLDGLDALVLLNPDTELGQPEAPEGWVAAVRRWVERGGRLLVVARAEHWDHGHIRSPLYLEGVELEAHPSPTGEISLASAAVGEGRIVLALGSEYLDVEAMDHSMAYPGRNERRRYHAAYHMFGELLGLELPDRKTYQPY